MSVAILTIGNLMFDDGIKSTDILQRLRVLIFSDPISLSFKWYNNYDFLRSHLPEGLRVDIFYLDKYTPDVFSKSFLSPMNNFSAQTYSQLSTSVTDHNIDIIYDPDKDLPTSPNDATIHQPFMICLEQKDLSGAIDAFLAGKGVVWHFDDPHLQLSWIYKYSRVNEGLSWSASDFYKLSEGDSDMSNMVRQLIGKCMQVEYTKDILSYNLMKINYERRNYSSKITRSEFEFGADLTNYYNLISSIFEILATIIYHKFAILNPDNETTDISKKVFWQKIKTHSPALRDLYKKNKDWTTWINQVRNYLSHTGYAFVSPLIKEPKGGIDEKAVAEEVQRIVQATFGTEEDSLIDKETYNSVKNIVEDEVRVSKHEVIAVDTMLIEDGKKNKKLFRPFFYTVKDYQTLFDLIKETRDNL